MSNNPYCLKCFETLGLNGGFNPEIKECIELDFFKSMYGKNGHICVNCLTRLVSKYNDKYNKKLVVFW